MNEYISPINRSFPPFHNLVVGITKSVINCLAMMVAPPLLLLLFLVTVRADFPQTLRIALENGVSSETFSRGNGVVSGFEDDDLIYATTSSGNVYTIGESDGIIYNWYHRNDAAECKTVLDWNTEDNLFSFAAYAVGNAVVLIDYLGSYMEEFTVDGEIVGQPLVKDGAIFVAHNVGTDGVITIYDPSGNAELGTRRSQRLVSGAQIGPLGGKEAKDSFLYFGTQEGSLWRIGTTPDYTLASFSGDPGSPLVIDETVTGKPFASNDNMLLPSPGGNLYWWRNEINGSPDYRIAISSEGSDADIAPVISKNFQSYFIVASGTIHSIANTIPPKFLWSNDVGESQTKPLLQDSDTVYIVKPSGTVVAFDASSGQPRSAFPYTPCASCGTAESVSSLTEKALYVAYSDGTVVGACITCKSETTSSPTEAESPIPTSKEPTAPPVFVSAPIVPEIMPTTEAPVAITTEAPVAITTEDPVAITTEAPVATLTPSMTATTLDPSDNVTVSSIPPSASPVMANSSDVEATQPPAVISESIKGSGASSLPQLVAFAVSLLMYLAIA